jgi:hypothetical protein
MTARSFAVAWASLGCLALMMAVTQAAKPGSGPDTTFVPTPQFPAEGVYDFDAELGGVLDLETGLVWGYDCTVLTNSNATYSGADSYFAANYPQILFNSGFPNEAVVAAEHEWRVPTLDEHKRAYANGLFVYGNKVWNFDASPAAGFQPVAYEGGPRWCSDPATKGKPGKAWFFDIGSGDYGQITVTSGIRAPVVVYSLGN